MPQRYSINREQLTSDLRRSPRFLHNSLDVPENPRRPRITSLNTPFNSTQKISIKKPQAEVGSRKVNELDSRSRERPVSPNIGLRRSARLVGRLEEFSYVELSPKVNEEKRRTRSSIRRNANSNVHMNNKGKLEKKATRSLCHGHANQFHEKIGTGFSTIQRSGASSALVEDGCKMERGNIDKGQIQVGVARKRNSAEIGHGIVQGWTKDQESALERAYFTARPTSQFWKKVARLVPGKSAQDCFNKVHSNHATPPQPQPRSRAKALNSSPLSFSASKLLNSSGPPAKRRKSHLVQKTVRHMLQKQCKMDQNSEADLFSVLENRMTPSTQATQQDLLISTPVGNQEKSELLERCQERSPSSRKKSLSRFCGSSGTTLVSPPVLKQVKNKAMHEKYIDLLHCREASRKVAFARAANSHQGNGLQKESHVQRKDVIKDAKNALVFDATDAIKQFQYSQANTKMNSLSDDDDDDGATNDEHEGEDAF